MQVFVQLNKLICVTGRCYDKSSLNQRYAAGSLRLRSPEAYSQTEKKLAEIAVHNFTPMNQGNGSPKSNERFLTLLKIQRNEKKINY